MATGGLTPLRGNNAQVGWSKQAAWGTAITPASFWSWRKGTAHQTIVADQSAREADAGAWENLAWREDIYGDFKIAEAVRMRTIGCSLQAFMGSGSDAYTPPTFATTVGTGGGTAGGTTISSTLDLTNIGNLAINLNPGIGSQTYEVVTIDRTTRTGTGPWTYTLAAGAKLLYNHVAAEPLTTVSTHVFTRQLAAYDPYTAGFWRGDGATTPFQMIQFLDSVCHDFQLASGPAGQPVMASHGWYARKPSLQAWGSPTFTLEGIGQTGLTGGPLTHAMAKGSWSLNGVTTGNMATIDKFTLSGKNATNAKEFLTEDFYPDYFMPDDATVDAALQVVFQSAQDYYNVYYGGVGTATTVASKLVFYAPFSVTYTMDAINALTISLPYCRYVASPFPGMDEKAGPVRSNISLRAMKSVSNPQPITITLANSQNSAY